MYIPGLKLFLALWILIIIIMVALFTRNPAILLPLFSLLGFLLGIRYGRELFYRFVPIDNIVALVSPDDVDVGEDFIVFKYRKGKKWRYYVLAFLEVQETEYVESEGYVGELSEFFIRSLHGALRPAVFVVNGEYYIRLVGCYDGIELDDALRFFASNVKALRDTLLAKGYVLSLRNPLDVLNRLGIKLEKHKVNRPSFKVPLAVLLSNLLGLLSLYFIPLTVALTISIWKHYLQLLKVGYSLFRVSGGNVHLGCRLYPEKYPSKHEVGGISNTMKNLKFNDILFIDLKPVDLMYIYRLESKSTEVMDKEFVAKFKDIRAASRAILLVDRIRKGEMPFNVSVIAMTEKSRVPLTIQFLKSMGITVGRISRDKLVDVYARVLGVERKRFLEIYERFEELVNPWHVEEFLRTSIQIAVFSPFSFVKSRTTGGIWLGHTPSSRDERVFLELHRLENVHGLLVGPPGSGKSTTARTIIVRSRESGIIPIVIDPSGEYRRFFEVIGGVIIDLVDTPFRLKLYRNLNEFFKAMAYVVPLSFDEKQVVKSMVREDITLAELYTMLERRYPGLAAKIGEILPYFKAELIDVEDVLSRGKPVLLCLGSVRGGRYVMMPIEVMRFSFHMLLTQLVNHALSMGLSKPRYMFIVDEAHLFAKPRVEYGEPIVTTVARVYRKFGVAVTLLTHSWSDVDETFRNFCGYTIALGASQPDYISQCRLYLGLDTTAVQWLKRGEPGNAVLKRIYTPHPILVKIVPEEIALTDYWTKHR